MYASEFKEKCDDMAGESNLDSSIVYTCKTEYGAFAYYPDDDEMVLHGEVDVTVDPDDVHFHNTPFGVGGARVDTDDLRSIDVELAPHHTHD